MTYVQAGEKSADVLKRLLRRAAKKGVKPELLLLDREYWTVDVIRYLQRARYPFLMPVIARGNKADHPKGLSGTTKSFRPHDVAGVSSTPVACISKTFCGG